MIEKKHIHNDFISSEKLISAMISNFNNSGIPFGNQDRNSLKLFSLNDETLNIKSFKIPNIINQITYKFFRKSKAQRSYEYANELINFGIGTPTPIAYFEFTTVLLFKNSYYVSKQQDCDLTYRELTTNFDYPNHEQILRAFTKFTFLLHENGVNFLDHSPGNTLIKKVGSSYKFYLVDLNRMQFGPMDFEARIKNFARLTTHKQMVEVMSDEYSKCINKPYEEVYNLMWEYTENFQYNYQRRRRLKKKLKFWRKG